VSYDLNVIKKSGFIITKPETPVNIRDYRGIMFYTTEPIMPVYDFNLPVGKYMVDSGYFKQAPNPINFKLEKLPISETALPRFPYDFKIVFAKNPNKCTIFWAKKLIVFDTRFEYCPLPELFFIFYHECGHARYGFKRLYSMKEAEAYCDLYASNCMLRDGFNPSQIMKAPKQTLSAKQDYRKNFIEEVLYKNA
jgi:hypothetical protein